MQSKAELFRSLTRAQASVAQYLFRRAGSELPGLVSVDAKQALAALKLTRSTLYKHLRDLRPALIGGVYEGQVVVFCEIVARENMKRTTAGRKTRWAESLSLFLESGFYERFPAYAAAVAWAEREIGVHLCKTSLYVHCWDLLSFRNA